jgi:hypothetical protein
MLTLCEAEAIDELLCDMEKSSPPLLHIDATIIHIMDLSILYLLHVSSILGVLASASIVHFEDDRES